MKPLAASGDLLRRYGLAVVLAAVALSIRGALPVPHGTSIYQLPLAAVLLSAWFGGRVPGLVTLLICVAGTLYWFIPPVHSFSIEAEHVLGFGLFIAVGCMLTEFSARQRRAEHALRASEERFRTLVQFSFDVYWESDAQHRFTRQEFTQQLPDAPARGSEIGKTRWEVPYLEPDEEAWRKHRATMDAHLPFRDFELARPTADGGKRYVSVSGMPVFDDRERFIGYRGVGRHITERKLAEVERRAHVWFLESMDRINRAMQGTNDLERMMSDVLEAVLEVFGSDRAWLLYPCDPDAPSRRVIMEHTRPEFPGVAAGGGDLPMSADAAEEARTARDSRGAVLAGPGHERQVTPELAERFGVRSKMLMALHPIGDRPYLFGLHQCHLRSWTKDEQRLFEEIGHRLGDALSSLIAFRSLRESERRLEAAQQIAHVGWWERDLVAPGVSMSDESCRIFGVQPVDLPQWRPGHWLSLIHPEDRAGAAAARDAALAGGSRYDMEYRVVRPDGTMRVVHSQGDITRDDSGRPLRQFGVIQDITELRQAEAQLRARQDMLDLAQTAAGAVAYDWYTGARESESRWSPELEALFGVEPGTFDGTYEGWKKLVHPDDWPEVKLAIKRAHESGEIATEYRVIHKDGSIHWLRGKGRMFFDAEGQPERNVGFIFDVTDWHQAQEELRASEARFRKLTDLSADWYWRQDENLRFILSGEEKVGFAPVALGKTRWELPATPLSASWDEHRAVLAARQPFRDFQYSRIGPEGGMRYVSVSGVPVFDERGVFKGYDGVASDITPRKRAEQALRESEARFRTFVDRATDAFFLMDDQIRVVDVNRQACESLGWSRAELIGMHPRGFDVVLDETSIQRLAQRGRAGEIITFETRHRRKDGTIFPVEVRSGTFEQGGKLFYLALARDISERELAEESLRQSEAYLTEAQRLSHTGSWAFDVASNRYVYTSEESDRLFGVDPQGEKPTREVIFERIHPEDRSSWKRNLEKSLREKVDTTDQYRVVLPDGTVRHIHTIRHPVMNGAGEVVKLVGTSIDITERKLAEESLRQSEAYLTEAQRLSHTGSWALDVATNRYVYTSEEFDRLFGFDPHAEAPTREAVLERMHPEDRISWKRILEKSVGEKVDTTSQYRIVLPDGTVRHIHTIRHPVVNSAGEVVKLVGTSIDITERKLAEEELRASEARFRTFVDRATDAFFLMDEEIRVVDVNRQACESLGWSREELIGMHPRDFDADMDETSIGQLAQRSRGGEIITFETRHRRKDGTAFPIEIRSGTFEQGGKLFYLALARDITDRKRAEESLRQSEAYLTEAQRLSHTGSWAFDVASNQYIYTSEEFDRIFGFDPQVEKPTRQAVLERMHPEDRISWKRSLEKSLREKVDTTDEYRIVLPDGRVRHIHRIRHPVLNSAGEVVKLVGSSIDITERKHAEEELRASEARFRTFVDRAADAFLLHDAQLRIVDVNRQACESLGRSREELIGMHPREYDVGLDEASMRRFAKRLAAGEIITFETRHRRKDGTVFPVEVRIGTFQQGGEPFYLALARDITERKLAEETLRGKDYALQMARTELAHVSRLTTLGELTTSIAHEVSQPLGGMVASAGACVRWLAADPPAMAEARSALDNILADGKRARDVIGRIRALTKRQVPRMNLLDVNRKILEVLAFTEQELRSHDIVLETRLDSTLPQVTGDRVQLQQVLLNLIVNATDSMSAVNNRPRELTVVSAHGTDGVVVEVRDSGIGLDAQGAERVFEAFYTTKAEGIGIGLSISRSIIEAHGGRLWATPNEPHGAVFRFSLPVAEDGQA